MLDHVLKELGWTRAHVARVLDVDTSTVDKWAKGARYDARVDEWLNKILAYVRKNPKPENWTARPAGRPQGSKNNSAER